MTLCANEVHPCGCMLHDVPRHAQTHGVLVHSYLGQRHHFLFASTFIVPLTLPLHTHIRSAHIYGVTLSIMILQVGKPTLQMQLEVGTQDCGTLYISARTT